MLKIKAAAILIDDFVSREKAAKIAIKSGQVKSDDLVPPGVLFIEDLW